MLPLPKLNEKANVGQSGLEVHDVNDCEASFPAANCLALQFGSGLLSAGSARL